MFLIFTGVENAASPNVAAAAELPKDIIRAPEG
jgi:hypothetical protein